MSVHSGTWSISPAVGAGGTLPSSALVFVSGAGVSVVLTVSRTVPSGTALFPLIVEVNGAAAANGTMDPRDLSRTFRLGRVTTIRLTAGNLPAGTQAGVYGQTGTYQISVL